MESCFFEVRVDAAPAVARIEIFDRDYTDGWPLHCHRDDWEIEI